MVTVQFSMPGRLGLHGGWLVLIHRDLVEWDANLTFTQPLSRPHVLHHQSHITIPRELSELSQFKESQHSVAAAVHSRQCTRTTIARQPAEHRVSTLSVLGRAEDQAVGPNWQGFPSV